MEKLKSIGIWIRVSTEDQAQGDAPETHERRARLYAEAKGWHVAEVYHLEAVSGKSVMEHPEAKRMLGDVRKGTITGLIFSKLARLARNTKELLEFADYFRDHDADLVSISEAIDTSTPAGRLFYTMIAAMAQWEREEIASRIAASVPIRARMGKQLAGEATFGYRWENQVLVIDEKEAPVRKLIYELFLKHKRKKTVAHELNRMGYRTRGGGEFTDTSVKRLLKNSTAKGVHLANYTTMRNGVWETKPESEWIFTTCPAIVSAEVWDECNRLLDEQTRKRPPGPKSVHLLTGFVTCDCGKKMYIYHRDLVYNCRPCRRRIPAEDIDEIFYEQLKEFLLTEMDVSTYVAKNETRIREKKELLRVTSEKAADIRRRMGDLVNMRLNNELTKEAFMEHHRPLEVQLGQMTANVPDLEAEVSFLTVQNESSDVVLSEAKNLYTRWLAMPLDEKRRIIETITDKIVIGSEEITIKLSHMPQSLQNSGKRQHMVDA
ncbi:MAG: recombinase family protein [Bacteroidetes bacterium]|nr:recombinase family protein [Bacteroidota bacterium]